MHHAELGSHEGGSGTRRNRPPYIGSMAHWTAVLPGAHDPIPGQGMTITPQD
jgi:hypothetical protein